MEALTRLVTESLARHGFDRPVDYRRLHWSRWFRCESHHSLLLVPSKPGVFALAEEILDLASPNAGSPAQRCFNPLNNREGVDFSRPDHAPIQAPALAAEGMEQAPRRMLAVTQFFEDDDMAFVLDRMLSHQNPLRARLNSGRYFVRFVVIEDAAQRRSICNALNQWIANSAEKASGIGTHFASSLELTPATEYIPARDHDAQGNLFDSAGASPERSAAAKNSAAVSSVTAAHLDSSAAANIHCPTPLPSGF
jgi:hypothetical protein